MAAVRSDLVEVGDLLDQAVELFHPVQARVKAEAESRVASK
jgi:hypothetical protein